MDTLVYDETVDKINGHISRFRKISRSIEQLILDCNLDAKAGSKNQKLLSKVQIDIKQLTRKLVFMDKTNKRFANRKLKLSNLKSKRSG